MDDRLAAHAAYIRAHGTDLPEVGGWEWGGRGAVSAAVDTGADNRR